MAVSKGIVELIERFDYNIDSYRSGSYKEAQLRIEFIDPLFKFLGWDVYNEQGYAEAYKDVIHEDSIKVKGAVKAPDYCFRIGGVRKFFVEAKKPSVSIRDEISPAFQLRRYAWSAKLPLSILTDFEEIAVYDCRIKPVKTDKASVARVLYMDYQHYGDKWDEISSIFSRDAILKGSFDKYVETSKRKHGTAEVDDAFLKEIESWREMLARNIALRNPGLTRRELNYAVQKTIDRIIFLRICEDRGIEDYGELRSLLDGEGVYSRLFRLFERADERYNSGLFHFSKEKDRTEAPDDLTPNLKVDDKHLKELIKRIYYPDSPYEFSVLPADILGQVYEQFLGKVIRLTPKHRAVIEDKPEVKKAGGVYYTPTYIVDYIVDNTVGKLLKGSTPKKAASFKILDPACGSGSFLLGAYQHLLNWHRDWYVEDVPEDWAKGRLPRLYKDSTGEWKLTTTERKRILLNNIYGVDIDPQAVEVTKLSLLLRVLEEETKQTIGAQLELYQERALPDLSNNIKCGNSLIGPDFFEQQQINLADREEVYHINAFDWPAEFPKIFKQKNPGFDAVVGNPPYVRQENIKAHKMYFKKIYEVYDSTADLYSYFIERSLVLTKVHGLFSFIVSNKFTRARYGEKLRKFIPGQSRLLKFIDFGDLPVFANATTYPCVFVLEKEATKKRRENNHITVCKIKSLDFASINDYEKGHSFTYPQNHLTPDAWLMYPSNVEELLLKIAKKGKPLKDYCNCMPLFGVKTGLNKVFIVNKKEINTITKGNKLEKSLFLPYLRGRNVHRYYCEEPNEYLLFTENLDPPNHQNVMSYLKNYRAELEARTDIRNTSKKWYELRPCSYYDLLQAPKIIYSSVAKRGAFTLDNKGLLIDKTCYFIPSTDMYLLGLLNSRLLFFYFTSIAVQRRGGYFEYLTEYVSCLPIYSINASSRSEPKLKEQIIGLSEQMLMLTEQMNRAKTAQEKSIFQRQIKATDQQIDQLVYKLYGLSEKEIEVVEKGM